MIYCRISQLFDWIIFVDSEGNGQTSTPYCYFLISEFFPRSCGCAPFDRLRSSYSVYCIVDNLYINLLAYSSRIFFVWIWKYIMVINRCNWIWKLILITSSTTLLEIISLYCFLFIIYHKMYFHSLYGRLSVVFVCMGCS